jgi:hypothetical protein
MQGKNLFRNKKEYCILVKNTLQEYKTNICQQLLNVYHSVLFWHCGGKGSKKALFSWKEAKTNLKNSESRRCFSSTL